MTIDLRSGDWLGKYSQIREIRQSGLWNVNHVEEACDRTFLDRLESAIEETTRPSTPG